MAHKKCFLFIAFLFCYPFVFAQTGETDSLKKVLTTAKDDKERVSVLENLSYAYLSTSPDTALQYALQGLQLAQDIDYPKGEAICTNAIGNVYFHTGDHAKALEMYLRYLQMKENLKDFNNLAIAYFNIGSTYTEEGDYTHALYYLSKAKKEDDKLKDTSAILYDVYSLASTYLRMQRNDSALFYADQSYKLAKYLNDEDMIGTVLNTYGEIYLVMNDLPRAENYYRQSMPYVEAASDLEVINANYYGLAKVYKQKGMLDSSIHYARKSYLIARSSLFFKQAFEVSGFLSELFKEKNKYDSAFHYQQLSIDIKDSLFNIEQVKKVQNLKFQEQQRQQTIETQRIKFHNTVKLLIATAISITILIIAIVLYRHNKQNQRANILLTDQKNKIESTLAELKATQAQLIQSEKMASLGELTAGIAHEIQNPLNFVNNFSEVNAELISEMKLELEKGNIDEVKAIITDLQENEKKINHHGMRADAIVKGMLQHSRMSTGQKEASDINALCDEYLRLSYHGLRAKDKSFNAELKADFDGSIDKIEIIPQDIGRVLLNLFNNAFYAVNEKKNTAGEKFQPMVSVVTKNLNDKIEIKIEDNGKGIPANIADKIFHPFFTTKPAGEGTGLGLSLSYDIIKAHGGQIKVESEAGKGTVFTVQLPV